MLLLLLVGTVQIALGNFDRYDSFYHAGIYYRIVEDGIVSVVKPLYYNNYQGDIVIPSRVTASVSNYGEDYSLSYVVTGIDPEAFKNCIGLTSIELPNTLKTIGDNAFYGCSGLSSITLSNGLESIGQSAFGNCTSLKSITIPNSVSSMGWNVFYGCSDLKNVTLSNHLRELNGTFVGCSSLESIKIPTSVVSLNGSFTNCTSLNTVAIPYSVSIIGNNAFMGCSGLVSVNIPNSVSQIGKLAFSNTALIVVDIPNTVTSIGQDAFQGCNQLTTVTSRAVEPPTMSNKNTFEAWVYENAKLKVPLIAESTYRERNWWNLFNDIIGNESLNNNYDFVVDGIYYLKVDENSVEVTYKDNNYNSYSGIVNVPASVTSGGKTYSVIGVGNYAFYNCSSLTGVLLPATITTIGSNAFANAGISAINLPDAVTTIATRAFYECTKLSSLTVPENVSSIGKEAFAVGNWLTQLTWNAKHCWSNGDITTANINKVTIGNTVEVLPINFVAHSKIATINIPASVSYIGSYAFRGCSSISNITIPKSVMNIGKDAFIDCTGLTKLTWKAKNCNTNGSMYTDNITEVTVGNDVETLPISFLRNSKITSINIPNSVKVIGGIAFSGCRELSNLSLPESIQVIGDFAFYGCSALTALTIPRSVISIGYYAFDYCDALSSLTWNAINCTTNGDMTTYNLSQVNIGNEVKKLPIGLAANSQITSISIPNSVDSICSRAFEECESLLNVDIPNSVIYIGDYVFKGCIGLTDVTIPDQVSSIGYSVFYDCTGLSRITIGASVESIYDAFSGCTSLHTVVSLPLTPPYISYYTFYGVPDDMTVYVLPDALEAYQSDYYWNRYTILPTNLDRASLTVNLPAGTDTAYVDMKLGIVNRDSDIRRHFVVSKNKFSYKFGALEFQTNWDVVLTNHYGDELGKIENVAIGEEDKTVTFTSLKRPQTVTLTVRTPDGQDVTGQSRISWLDESGELLAQGKEIGNLPFGRKLVYSVRLPQQLATKYSLPANRTYTVAEGNNNIICQLNELSEVHFSGIVKEAEHNQPLYGASVSVTQTFAGGNANTLTSMTDSRGTYSMDAYSVPTTITVAAQGFKSQTLDCAELITGENEVVLPPVTLQPIKGATVTVNLTYTPAHVETDSAEIQNWYGDYQNVDYEVFNKTTDYAISDVSEQYPQIVLMDDVNDGDELELTAISRNNDFQPINSRVTLVDQRATASFNIKEPGKVIATFNKNTNPEVIGTLYNAQNKLVRNTKYTRGKLVFEDVPDGKYTLVTMGENNIFNSIYDMDRFTTVGLNAGVDYVSNEIDIEKGIIKTISIDEVPFFDETKFNYISERTSFSVNTPEIIIGNYITFRSQIVFKDQFANMVSDVQLIFDIPESSSLIDNSVMIGNALGTYSVNGNCIIVPINNNSIVRLCTLPQEIGDFSPSAFVRFRLNGVLITQPIGNTHFTVQNVSINVPSLADNTSIPVTGTSCGVCDIFVYDNNVLIGQTTSLSSGMWSTRCELFEPNNLSKHNIFAKVVTKDGLELRSDVKVCDYDKYANHISKVIMYHHNSRVIFDYQDPKLSQQYYSYNNYNKKFTFTIEFTENDTSKISNVVLYVKTAKSGWWPLETFFDENKGLWYAEGVFGDVDDLPVNVAVDYDVLTYGPVSRQSITNADFNYAVLAEQHNEINSQYEEFANQFENGNISSEEFETLYDELTSMETSDISGSEYASMDLDELLSLSSSLINASESNINDSINLAFSDLGPINFFDLNDYGIDGSFEIKSTEGISIDQLISRGFEKISIDDDSEVYQLVSESSYEIVDFKKGTYTILEYTMEPDYLTTLIAAPRNIQSLYNLINQISQKLSVIFNTISRINEGISIIPTFFDTKKAAIELAIAENTEAYKALQYYEGMMPTLEENLEITEQIKKLKGENIKLGKELAQLCRTFQAVMDAIGKVSTIVSAFIDQQTARNNASAYADLWYSVPNCKDDQSRTEQLKRDILNAGLRCAGKDLANVIGDAALFYMIFGGVEAAPVTAGTSLVACVAGIGLSMLKSVVNNWSEKQFAIERANFLSRITALANDKNCEKEEEEEDPNNPNDPNNQNNQNNQNNSGNPTSNSKGEPYSGTKPKALIDPAGFVYEGVPSNRLQGVTATCYYKETVEEMYGDTQENTVLWDAEQYGQENPLLTDENGYYRWDVPIGMWQVKYEKDGYETTYSDWLPVPPPQLDVNIGMVQMRQPEVIKARAYPKAVQFEFDKFMFPETLTPQNIKVYDEYGYEVYGTIELLNAELDDPLAITSIRRAPGTGLTFASRVRFNAYDYFYDDEVTLKVSHRVKSYADLEMSEDYVVTLPVEYEMEEIVADSTIIIPYGDSRQLNVSVLPAYASRGKTLTVRSTSSMIATTDAEQYVLDNNGKAVITVHGDLPGMTSLLFSIDGYDLTAATLVNVMMENQMTVAAPTASIASGSEVEKGTAVYLRCSTPDATIYYTLDGSCPCDPTPARKVYDGNPIIINGTTTIKAMATAPDLYDSDVATFVYRVGSGIKGDVNNDGEVNIADVNAIIGIILGISTDDDIIYRADVNGDTEINIADVNEIIRIILGTSRALHYNVNCDDALHLNDVQLKPGEVRTLNVTLDNAERYSALQCDIVLPNGLTLVDVNCANGRVSKTGVMNDSTTRAMLYSMNRHQFTSNGSPVITLTVRADATLPSHSWITLANSVLADNQDKAWHIADCAAKVSNTTGINNLTAISNRVWTEDAYLCIESQQDGIARISTIGGIMYEVAVTSGTTRYELAPGIYVVTLNGNSYKIAIK